MTAINPGARVSPDFVYAEFMRSQTADRHGITIEIEERSEVHLNLMDLVAYVMQPLRDGAEAAVRITSGYRPPDVNRLVGGAPDSQHVTAEACDFWIEGMDYEEAAQLVVDLDLPFDQLIVEHDQQIVHVSHVRGPNRGEVLTRYTDSGTINYVHGLWTEGELREDG